MLQWMRFFRKSNRYGLELRQRVHSVLGVLDDRVRDSLEVEREQVPHRERVINDENPLLLHRVLR